MSYFIDRDSRTVIWRAGKSPMPREAVVDGETAPACNLTHGQVLTVQQMGYLLDGSISAFNASIAGGAAPSAATHGSEQLRAVPPRPNVTKPAVVAAGVVVGTIELAIRAIIGIGSVALVVAFIGLLIFRASDAEVFKCRLISVAEAFDERGEISTWDKMLCYVPEL